MMVTLESVPKTPVQKEFHEEEAERWIRSGRWKLSDDDFVYKRGKLSRKEKSKDKEK